MDAQAALRAVGYTVPDSLGSYLHRQDAPQLFARATAIGTAHTAITPPEGAQSVIEFADQHSERGRIRRDFSVDLGVLCGRLSVREARETTGTQVTLTDYLPRQAPGM